MHIRLTTANLLNDRADVADLARVLDLVQPDVMVNQELGHEASAFIAERFPHHMLRPALDHRGRGMASRFPAGFGELPLTWRPGLWGRLDLGPVRLLVATVHMRNAVTLPWWRSVRIRGEQVEDLFRWADDNVTDEDSFVVAGDMNASPSWPVYQKVAERWEDLIAAAAVAGARPEPTWGWRPGWPRMLRIDHVFGRGARVMETRIDTVKGTDHAAVTVDLELG